MAARADAQPDLVARGEYLTRAADCASCHTAPGGTPFAGGRAFTLPVRRDLFAQHHAGQGRPASAPTATTTGSACCTTGVGRGGKHLYPAMPYAVLHANDARRRAGDQGLSVEPARRCKSKVPGRTGCAFPSTSAGEWSSGTWSTIPINASSPTAANPRTYNRGAYLVEALGHCGECHTPRNFMMGLKEQRRSSPARSS